MACLGEIRLPVAWNAIATLWGTALGGYRLSDKAAKVIMPVAGMVAISVEGVIGYLLCDWLAAVLVCQSRDVSQWVRLSIRLV